jgi:hypothetical protein
VAGVGVLLGAANGDAFAGSRPIHVDDGFVGGGGESVVFWHTGGQLGLFA